MTDLQFQIDFDSKLPPSAQEGIATAYEHADVDWKARFDRCIAIVASRQQELTVDHVLAEMGEQANVPSTHTLSAMSGAMKRAAKDPDQILVPTEKMVRSEIGHKHGNWRRVYRSLIYRSNQQIKG